MARALRHAIPQANRQMIVRPRLLELVRGRFERAATVVVAGPGSGKTTLLAQAVAENRMAPLGRDLWLACQRDDTSLSILARGVFSAVDVDEAVPESPEEAAAVVADAMWSAAPAHVALILDDAHHIAEGSPGQKFLNCLLEDLPRNGHVVLGWRTEPGWGAADERAPTGLPPGASRLLAQGEALVIGDDDLQFTPTELVAFAESRGVPLSVLSEVDGWPALAELAASVGTHAVVAYLWDQLLSQLSRERRHALAVLAEVGGADDEIAAALLGRGVQLSRLLEGLPMVVRSGSGWWSLHALWGTALQHLLDAAEAADAQRVAGRLLAGRRQYHDAISLLLDAEAWQDALDVVVEVCKACTPLVPQDVLELWWHRLPPPYRRSPEGLLLNAMILEPTAPGSAENLLKEALEAAESANLQYACVNALVQLAFWRNGRGDIRDLAAKLEVLVGSGFTEAEDWLLVLTALLEPSVEQARSVLMAPSLSRSNTLNPVQQWIHTHVVLRKLGDVSVGEKLARRSLEDSSTTMRAVSRAALVEALRLQGELDEPGRMLRDLENDLEHGKLLTSPELLTHTIVLSDLVMPPEHAESLLTRFSESVARSPVAWAGMASTLAAAFHAVSVRDEAAAKALLERVQHVPLIHSRTVVLVSTAALPLLYVLMPSTRHAWDDGPAPGALDDVLSVCRALVALRERGSAVETAALSPRARQLVRTMMPVPWAAELGVGMVSVELPEGRALIEELRQQARPVLRQQAVSPHPSLKRTAKRLLETLPVKPSYDLDLRVLGPLELRRDGALVPDVLSRERVRQLVAYLLTHARPTRAEIMEALWPDLDERAASQNLRFTLNQLNDVLEPERGKGDATYFLRSTGAVLHLVVGDGLEVDATTFERLLDEAKRLEGTGVPSQALAAYQRALDLWRGDYFAETSDDEGWLEEERLRLRRRFVHAAVRAGQLLTAAGHLADAERLAGRALRADPWDERAHQVLIQGSLSAGDFVEARARLGRCLRMLRELGVPPDGHTATLAKRISSAAR